MRHGKIHLDLSTHELLTDPEVTEPREIRAGAHFIRTGDPDPKALATGGHPDGEPIRIARDMISGKYFAQVFQHLPSDEDSPRAVRLRGKAEKMKPFHVPGHGYWLPLEELFPNHPHVKLYNEAPTNLAAVAALK